MVISHLGRRPGMSSFLAVLTAICSAAAVMEIPVIAFISQTTCAMALDSTSQDVGSEMERPSASPNGSVKSALVFQTSFCIIVPCPTKVISPPAGHKPPVRLVIAAPARNGTYPVILFKHGFDLANCFYTQLFKYLAFSGYIVVAPQAVTPNVSTAEEIRETAEVANWISKSLEVVLDAADTTVHPVPDVSKLVIAGHSRGGKIAFALALGKATDIKLPNFSALVTLDPVDGADLDSAIIPQMVQAGCNHTLNSLSIPVLILGTGYGSKRGGLFGAFPPCAPPCCSHAGYFNCSSSPIMYHFSVVDYGHLDFLNDLGIWTSWICKSGKSRATLRNFSGLLISSFLRATLEGDDEDLENILQNWKENYPKLDQPQVYTDESGRLFESFSEKDSSPA